jgi:hypothetical protein
MSIQKSKYSSQLSPEDVEAIRAEPLPTRHADLARRYGVAATTIARIRRGLTWPQERPVEVRVRVPAPAVAGLEDAARSSGKTPADFLASAAVRAAESRRRAKSEDGSDP